MTITITTNNVPRDVIDGWELTAAETEQFDYIDWAAVVDGRESASFFRYKGEVHDLGDFLPTRESYPFNTGIPALAAWDGYRSDSFFSGLVVRYTDNYESVIVGRYMT